MALVMLEAYENFCTRIFSSSSIRIPMKYMYCSAPMTVSRVAKRCLQLKMLVVFTTKTGGVGPATKYFVIC